MERSGAERREAIVWNMDTGTQARQIGRQASQANEQAGRQVNGHAGYISPSNMAVAHRYAPRAPYTKEKGPRHAAVGPPPLSLGRLKFNSGTGARRGCQIAPRSLARSARSLSPSLATVRYRTFDLHRARRAEPRGAGRFSSRRYHRVAATSRGKLRALTQRKEGKW